MDEHDKVNILLVEDQPAKLRSYEGILGELGENLLKAASAREALAHLLHTDIAVALMDVHLPEIDGFELAAMLHQHPRARHTAILFISGVPLRDLDRLRGYAHGAVDYLPVPIIPELLRAKVRVFAELYRQRAALQRESVARQRLEREAQRAQHLSLLGRLAASMSHELRSPLSALTLQMELLQEEIRQPSPDSAAAMTESLTEITTQLARLHDLVDDYLSLARVATIERTPQDLGAAVATWAPEWESLAATHQVTLQLEGLTRLGQAVFHANTLRRVLLNLVHNALEAMPHGGTLTLAGERLARQVQLHVRDTGSGIPAAQLPHIFEPFYTTKAEGTGLGLYIVREIMTAHAGQITVQSVEGQGTTFTVTLPLSGGPHE
jgi:signal transduction histidine kinase